VATFLFSPDGQWIAFVDGQGIKNTFGSLQVMPAAGGEAKKVGENVVEHRWAPNSQAIAFRESNEDKAGRSWNSFKVATLPTGAIRLKEDGVPNFVWSWDGSFIAYLKRVTKPVYSVDLFLLKVAGDTPARQVDKGVFGYQFAPGDHDLWYRTSCVRSGRECDLMSASVPDATALPKRLVQGVWNFKPTAKGDRLLLTYPRLDTEVAADLGWFDLNAKAPSKGIDQYVLPGTHFVDDAGTGVVYLVGERKREGVYFAEIK
jgi:dipeptidyl aminopeptidase/acylaminoacyl peptidase